MKFIEDSEFEKVLSPNGDVIGETLANIFHRTDGTRWDGFGWDCHVTNECEAYGNCLPTRYSAQTELRWHADVIHQRCFVCSDPAVVFVGDQSDPNEEPFAANYCERHR